MGIKSFQGRRAEPEKIDCGPLCVKDYMSTKLITFKKEQTILEVMDELLKHKISGGCVVDDDDNLIGVISEGDCMKHISDSRYYNLPVENNLVEKRMTRNAVVMAGDMNVFDAAKKFIEHRFRRFPIVTDGKLIGQISQSDIMRAALNLKGHSWEY